MNLTAMQTQQHHMARHVPAQGLTGHEALAELDVSLNHLYSEGAQHLARLIVTLPALQQLHVAAIGMRADGLQALSMQVGVQRSAGPCGWCAAQGWAPCGAWPQCVVCLRYDGRRLSVACLRWNGWRAPACS